MPTLPSGVIAIGTVIDVSGACSALMPVGSRTRLLDVLSSLDAVKDTVRIESLLNELCRELESRRMNVLPCDDEGDLRAAMSKRVKESAGSALALGKKLADAMDRNDDDAGLVDMAAEENESSATEQVCSSLRAGGTAS